MTDRKRKKALGAILVIVFLFGVCMTVRQQLVYQSVLASSAEAVQVADLPKAA